MNKRSWPKWLHGVSSELWENNSLSILQHFFFLKYSGIIWTLLWIGFGAITSFSAAGGVTTICFGIRGLNEGKVKSCTDHFSQQFLSLIESAASIQPSKRHNYLGLTDKNKTQPLSTVNFAPISLQRKYLLYYFGLTCTSLTMFWLNVITSMQWISSESNSLINYSESQRRILVSISLLLVFESRLGHIWDDWQLQMTFDCSRFVANYSAVQGVFL